MSGRKSIRSTPRRTPRFDFQKWWAQHPLKFLIGIAVVAGGGVLAVCNFFETKITDSLRTSLEESEKQRKFEAVKATAMMASINRSMAGGSSLDVRKFVIRANDGHSPLPEASYFADGAFYAMDINGWTHAKKTIDEVGANVFGVSSKPDPFAPPNIADIWVRGEPFEYCYSETTGHLSPMIIVQHQGIEEFAEHVACGDDLFGGITANPALIANPAQNTNPALITNLAPNTNPGDRKADAKKMVFRDDLLGAYLSEILDDAFQLRFADRVRVSLINVQKIDNSIYSQVRITVDNAKVAGKLMPVYFVNLEVIMLLTKDSVYLITTVNPSSEPVPRGPVAAEITTWLAAFNIVDK